MLNVPNLVNNPTKPQQIFQPIISMWVWERERRLLDHNNAQDTDLKETTNEDVQKRLNIQPWLVNFNKNLRVVSPNTAIQVNTLYLQSEGL